MKNSKTHGATLSQAMLFNLLYLLDYENEAPMEFTWTSLKNTRNINMTHKETGFCNFPWLIVSRAVPFWKEFQVIFLLF